MPTIEGIPSPCGVAISKLDGSIFISSYNKRSVFQLDSGGEYIGHLDVDGYVTGVEVSNDGRYLYACNSGQGLVYKLKIDSGNLTAVINCRKCVGSCYPETITCCGDSSIHVSGRNTNKILVFNSSDALVRCDHVGIHAAVTAYSKGQLHVFGNTSATVLNPAGDVQYSYRLKTHCYDGIVTDEGYAVLSTQSSLSVHKAVSDGKFLYSIGGFGDTCGIAVDRNGSVWVADRWKDCIFRIPEVFIPPFSPASLSSLSHQMILLYLNEMPVTTLPPRISRLYRESTQLVSVKVVSENGAAVNLHLLLRLKTNLPILLVEWIVQKRIQAQLPITECEMLFVTEESSPFKLEKESLLQPCQTNLIVHIRSKQEYFKH